MGEEQGLEPGVTDDAARAAEPGTVSRLLQELAKSPPEDAAAAWREPLEAGDLVGRYQIRREIGRGGFGAVYEAFDPELGRTVALKALKPGRNRHQLSEEWIKKEAEAVAKLDHPAIVTIFDVGTCPAGAYLVMELLRGETLAKRIEKGPLPVDEALRVAEQMAEGLAHAHSRGVLHRDLKPANVFVSEDGRVKLLDFGLAHLLGTEGSSGAGTPAYMAPEQAAGAAVDERADVWAAGMVLGEMLTGKRPVERTPSPEPGASAPDAKTELMWEAPKAAAPAVAGEPTLGGVPRPVARAVEAALAEDPATRPKDGTAWIAALRATRLRLERPRRNRRVAAFATAFILVGLTIAGIATWRIWKRQIPTDRVTVAVADFANETGEKELDSISGLLITSLEQSARFRVLTRGRMFDLVRQLGHADVQRIDEPLAREVGRKGDARALLLATIRKLGDAYVVDMRALDPLTDEYLFTVSDRASGKAAVFDLVDRLAEATRGRLGAGDPAEPRRVAALTTENVKAWQLLFQSRQAFDRARYPEADRLAEEALLHDPDFALAHYQRALTAWWVERNSSGGLRKAHGIIEAAERHAASLPDKERLSLLAMRAGMDGRWDEVKRLRDRAAGAFPLDKEVLLYAADARVANDEYAEAIPILERTLQLDPQFGVAIQLLLQSLEWTGRSDQHLDWIRGMASAATEPDRLRDLGTVLLAAGQEAEALELWRRHASTARYPRALYTFYLNATGRAEESEGLIRAAMDRPPPAEGRHPDWLHAALEMALLTQGRFRELSAHLEERSADPDRRRVVDLLGATAGRFSARISEALEDDAWFDAATGPMGETWQAVVVVALSGHPVRAGRAAARLRSVIQDGQAPGWRPSPTEAIALEAVEAWGAGATDTAAAKMRELSASSLLSIRYLAFALLAELLREKGDLPGAVDAFEAALATKWSLVMTRRVWSDPGLLYSLALCYERLGDLPKARERNGELLKRWEKADEDIPLLIEAKAMRERLAVK